MRTLCFPRKSILLLGLFIGLVLPFLGCNDDSKTSGTMVERSEEAKAHMKTKIESYKGGSPKSRGKGAGKKNQPAAGTTSG